MKPEQFIREQGLDAIKDCIEEAEAYGGFYVNAKTLELSKYIPSYDAVSITELKRLVEALDLIEKVGGIKKAKHMLELFEDRKGRTDNYMPLFRAVQDRESIYGGRDA